MLFFRNDETSELATRLCRDLEGLYDSIKQASSRKKLEYHKMILTYICCRLGLLNGQWILKVRPSFKVQNHS